MLHFQKAEKVLTQGAMQHIYISGNLEGEKAST